jgi:hypothetical protein
MYSHTGSQMSHLAKPSTPGDETITNALASSVANAYISGLTMIVNFAFYFNFFLFI